MILRNAVQSTTKNRLRMHHHLVDCDEKQEIYECHDAVRWWWWSPEIVDGQVTMTVGLLWITSCLHELQQQTRGRNAIRFWRKKPQLPLRVPKRDQSACFA